MQQTDMRAKPLRPSRLKRERKKVKLNQAQLARLSGVGQPTISRIERGHLLSGSFDTLHKLALALRLFGRKVDAQDLQPKRQHKLVRGIARKAG